MGGSTTISNTEQKLGTLRVQTSMYGLAVRLMWGQVRVPGNLLWFGNFEAVAKETVEEQGGKGGGGIRQVDITYSYYAAAIMALGRGPIAGIASAWKDKRRYTGADEPGEVRTVKHSLTIAADGPVALPLVGVTYVGLVGVTAVDAYGYGDGENAPITGPMYPGINFTDNGAGTLTFIGISAPVNVTITYQVQDPVITWPNALASLGLSLARGRVGQPVWPWLQTFSVNKALAYSGMAYVYADRYQLTNQAEVENHSFEVVTGFSVGGGVVDAWPHDIVVDFLTNRFYGVGWKTTRLSALTDFTNYCKARKLWLSPVMEEQKPARDWMQALADMTNSEWVWQGTVLDLVPRGDEEIVSTYGTYTPSTVPAFDLVHAEGGDILAPVEIEPVVNEDAKNIIRVEWTNRANGYTIEIMEARDAAHIEVFGERPAEVVNMQAIHDPRVAQSVAQQILQRNMTVWNKYKFRTPFNRALISLMTLVTLTDADSALDRTPVRIIGRRELGNMEYEFDAEDAPIGAASAPEYGDQAGEGFSHDFNVAPGSVQAPVFFEAPVRRISPGGLEVLMAVTGQGSTWGGCNVHVSLDGGLTYEKVDTIRGGSRYGKITGAINSAASSVSVLLEGKGGKLFNSSANAAAQNKSLIWIDGPSGGEFMNYVTATLTGPNAYTLSGLVRAAYNNPASAHSLNAKFVRVDERQIGNTGPLDTSLIGSTIHVKFTSFNIYGGGEQDIGAVSAYTYTITGDQLKLPPGNVGTITKVVVKGSWRLDWADVPSVGRIPIGGYEVRSTNSGWGDSNYLYRGPASKTPFLRMALGLNTVYVRAYFEIDGRYSAVSATISHTFDIPANVTSLALARQRARLKMTATATPPADLKYFEFRIKRGVTTGDVWGASLHDHVVRSDTAETTFPLTQLGDYRVACRMVDDDGNASAASALANVSIAKLPVV